MLVAFPPPLVMREHDLNIHIPPQLAHSRINLDQCVPRQTRINMHTPNATTTIIILGNSFFSAQDPRVMTTIPAEVNILRLANARKKVHMPVNVSRAIDDVDAAVPKEVDRAGKAGEGVPRPLIC
ncbi:hypothetical protein O1611_g8714 [Lasiodiplodia mahajangana]|uniref:Uncharacterized protein n=1 Tax=Lasiodiplodia mahajangana TaxID=1108764 RepID=A0ACC2JBR4_9PEZI|nr:hypothetical protein O1611_g8714 [Lasiodiplodia mahajangana]